MTKQPENISPEIQALINMGLNEKEAQVYFACLILGPGSAAEIAQTAQLKRPNTYVVLETLKRKGLVTQLPHEKTTRYAAEDPVCLQHKTQDTLKKFSHMLPYLQAQHNRGAKPKIRFYEGSDALYNLYTREIFPADTIYFYGTSVKKIMNTWPDLFTQWETYWWPKKDAKKIIEIVGNEKEDIAYAKSVRHKRDVRILPPGKKFLADSAVTDKKILITSIDNLFAVLIESTDLAETYKTLIELAYQSAVSVKLKKQKNYLTKKQKIAKVENRKNQK